MTTPKLRTYQENLKDGIYESIKKQHKGIVAVSPTGSGKSKTMGSMCCDFIGNGKQVVFVVHRQELVKQLSIMLGEYQLPHQIIAAKHTINESKMEHFQNFGQSYLNPFADNIYVCSVQTLASMIKKNNCTLKPDVIFFDEGHHVSEGSLWGVVREAFDKSIALKFTASPERLDGKGLGVGHGGYATDIVVGPYVDDLIDGGYLSDYIAIVPSEPINVTGLRESKTGGMAAKAANEFFQSKGEKVCADLLKHYSKHTPHKPMVAYAVNVKASEGMADQFRSAGFNAVAINGNTKQSIRNKALKGLENGDIEVVCNADLISEGFDVPNLAAVGLCRPTQSLGLHIQQVGRPLRPHASKKAAYIYDCVGNIQNLEHFPCTRREWSLEGKKGRKKEGDKHTEKIRKCPSCFAEFRYKTVRDACPSCGYVTTPEENQLFIKEIEMKQITPEELKEMRDLQRAETKQAQNAGIRNAKTDQELVLLDKKLGLKRGASAHKQRAIEEKKKAMSRLNTAINYYKQNVAWGSPEVFDRIMNDVFEVSEKDARKYGAVRANRLCDTMREFLELRNSQIEEPYSSINYKMSMFNDIGGF